MTLTIGPMMQTILDIEYRDLPEEEKLILKLKGVKIIPADSFQKISYGLMKATMNKNAHLSERSDHRKE